MKVAIVGAPRTGKTTLAQALSARLNAQGLAVEVVDAALLARISDADIVLLCGLDLGHLMPLQSEMDQMIRSSLQRASLNFQVVYGSGEQRSENALFCIANQTPHLVKQLQRPEPPTRWSGPCETCGDGDCEHRLFTSLVKG
jgi:hypothetical protein